MILHKKRLVLVALLLLLLSLLTLWAVRVLASHSVSTPATIPVKYGVPQEVPSTSQQPEADPSVQATDQSQAEPESDQPAPYTLLDFSVNNDGKSGFANTESFLPPTAPAFNWLINVSFTPVEGQGTQALLFVMNADTDCSQDPPNTFGCGVINLADVESHNQPITFSFPEQGMTNKVYLKLAAGDWHVTVTAYDKPLYTAIRAETMADFYGN